MRVKSKSGFTIVEVSAVIAITGLVFIAVMGGITVAIQRQRFTDAVFTTQSYIQSQYDAVVNVINNRDASRKCDDSDASAKPRGQADCVILGRVLVFNAGITDGTTDDGLDPGGPTTPEAEDVIKSYAVIADATNRDVQADSGKSSLEVINELNPFIQSERSNNGQYIVPWGARFSNMIRSDNGNPVRAVAILRSPQDGSLGLYVVSTDSFLATEPILSSKTDNLAWKKDIKDNLTPFSNRIQACMTSSTQPTMRAGLFIRSFASKDGVTTEFDQEPTPGGVCLP